MSWQDKLTKLNQSIITMAKSKNGLIIASIVCFCEPIFLPLFPEIVLAPVIFARREDKLKIYLLAILMSVLGAFTGYMLGYSVGKALLSYYDLAWIDQAKVYLSKYGLILPLLASLFPLPLKFITLTCGFTHFNLFILLISVLIGRAFRFSLLLLVPQKRNKSTVLGKKIKRKSTLETYE